MPITKMAVLLPVLALSLGLSLTGCGNDPAPTSSAPGGGTTEDDGGAAVKYAQCMRQNGVPEFPDPVDGRITIKGGPGSGLNPESEAFKSASEKCKEFAPSGATGGGNADAQAQMLKYVGCMRKNGVPNFPDPENGQIRFDPNSGVDPQSAEFQQAEQACKDLMPGGAG